MQRYSALFLCVLGLVFNACEKHPASELEGEHGPGAAHAAEAKHEATATPESAHEAKPAAGAPHGEAPKFFPEHK